jgi:hypothetical protein
MTKTIIFLVTLVFLLNPLLISMSNAEVEAVPVMTLPDGTVVNMTPAQLSALAAQPGITISTTTPVIGAREIAIPIPAALGGGYIVGTPAAIASALGATGIAPGVTAKDVVGATASAGTLMAGALAGTLAGLGTTGTLAAGGAVVAGVIAGILTATGGGGEGGGRPPAHAPAHAAPYH